MENPFAKLVREGELLIEKKKVVNTIYKIMNDRIYIQDVYEDGSVAEELTELSVNPSDSIASREAYKDYRRRRGIKNWAELDV